MKKRVLLTCLGLLMALGLSAGVSCINEKNVQAATYKVTPSKFPSSVKKSSAYNKYTKHWLLLQYYLKKLQKKGGTLVIKKGTYKIPNTLYVPSNTTIKLENGASLVKTNKTGLKSIKPAKNMIACVKYDNSKKKNASKKFNGAKNIKFIGSGSANINMDYISGAHGITMAHNYDVYVTGITFKNINGGHALEINSTKKATVRNCTFTNGKYPSSKYYNKEAINIDSADSTTGGFTMVWGAKDKYSDSGILIERCKFEKQNRAIGSHQYSATGSKIHYHTNMTIQNNIFKDMYDTAIYLKAWDNTKIYNNSFTYCGYGSKLGTSLTFRHAISGGGVKNLKVQNNKFYKVKMAPVYLVGQTNNGKASYYKTAYNYLSYTQLKAMEQNYATYAGTDKKGYYHIVYFSKPRPDGTFYGFKFTNPTTGVGPKSGIKIGA